MAGRHAFELFQRPLNGKIKPRETSFYELHKGQSISHPEENITYYDLGKNEDHLIVMVHGWESNAASLSAIADRLVSQGNRVVLFNLPAHGHSGLRKTNLMHSKKSFLRVIEHLHPTQPFSVVAHSFGSAVTAFGLSKSTYDIDQLVFLTSPNRISKIFSEYQDFIKLGKKSGAHFRLLAEGILQTPLDNLVVENSGKGIMYNHLLLIHDKNDKIIPLQNSVDISDKWSNAELMFIEKSGHYRMLWDERVIDKISKVFEKRESNLATQKSMDAMAY